MPQNTPQITFIEQNAPIDEYGRALYAICRSILRALIDSVTDEDLTDLNTPLDQLSMRAFAKIARLERDKGMRGDGFEWAIHEAIMGREPTVMDPISQAMRRASSKMGDRAPNSILFGHERARFLGFMDAVVDEAGWSPTFYRKAVEDLSTLVLGFPWRQKVIQPKLS